MTLQFKLNQLYRTRDGRKAQIFMLDNGAGMTIGAIFNSLDVWSPCMWHHEGNCLPREKTRSDLVSEWREPIKYSVELWGNEWSPDTDIEYTLSQHITGIHRRWAKKKVEDCPIKYRVTVEEIDDTANS